MAPAMVFEMVSSAPTRSVTGLEISLIAMPDAVNVALATLVMTVPGATPALTVTSNRTTPKQSSPPAHDAPVRLLSVPRFAVTVPEPNDPPDASAASAAADVWPLPTLSEPGTNVVPAGIESEMVTLFRSTSPATRTGIV